MSVTPTSNVLINKYIQIAATALTTRFTAPSACTNPLNYPTGDNWAVSPRAGCAPFNDYFYYQNQANSWYSPGVCPYQYEYVATSVQKVDGEEPLTLAICCPPGVGTWSNPEDWRCRHTIEASDSSGFFSPFFTASASSEVLGRALDRGPVSVAWRASDLPSFTPASAPLSDLMRIGAIGTTSSGGSTGSPATSSASSQDVAAGTDSTPAPADSGSALSTGETVGIAVGTTLVVVALIIGLWCILRRYQIKFAKRERSSEDVEIRHEYQAKHEWAWPPQAGDAVEVPGAEFYEVEGRPRKVELEAEAWRAEARTGMRSPAWS